jgi:NAD(P)-dependent dehydrogenase (short-subunit alcohol dehydrogenase family)
MDKLLDGKVVVVTGGGRGIGRCYAVALAAEGAQVVVNDVGSPDHGDGSSHSPADEVVREIEGAGGAAAANYNDVSDFEGAAEIIQTALGKFGRMDAVICNAAIERSNFLFELTEDDWDKALAVNAKGTFNVAHHAARAMREQGGGAIILVTSGAAFSGTPRIGAYSASKAAVYSLNLTLAAELEDSQVSVNCISPGATRTRLVDSWIADMKQDLNMTDEQIMATYGIQQPENMAPLAVYLCTDEGRKITGRTFEVAGDAIHLVPPPARHPSAINPHEGLWTTEDMRKVIPRLLAGQP